MTLLIEDRINNLGYTLYDVEYVKEGKDYFLRIYIDDESGINIEDCEKVSKEINNILDKEDYVKEQYFLEVSSPGVERLLKKDKHLEDNIGKNVQMKLYKPLGGKKEYVGKLISFDEKIITIEVDNTKIEIEKRDTSQIKTVYKWNEENN